MSRERLFSEFKVSFGRRKFVAGLLIAMIDLLEDLGVPEKGISSYDELVTQHPRRETTQAGARANTLILSRGDSTVSLRPFYNKIETHFRAHHKRFDFPSCAPHATQAWSDYRGWIDMLCSLNRDDLDTLRSQVVDFVLRELPSHEFDPSTVVLVPPRFRLILEEFDFSARKGEKSGAAFQGAVFGFMRADNPHLQVDVERVRTGSKRLNRVGDIDSWDGERLAITAEVKSMQLRGNVSDTFTAFAGQANIRGAIGIVAALELDDEAREAVSSLGLVPLDIEDLTRIVQLWDPAKQDIASRSMVYYAIHVEKNDALSSRLVEFIANLGARTRSGGD